MSAQRDKDAGRLKADVGGCRYYVYALYHEDGMTPFYIGKGCGNRCYRHLKPAPWDRSRKASLIRSMVAKGVPPKVAKLRQRLREVDAFELEARLVRKFGRYPQGPLLNETDGGKGGRGRCSVDEREWLAQMRQEERAERAAERKARAAMAPPMAAKPKQEFQDLDLGDGDLADSDLVSAFMSALAA